MKIKNLQSQANKIHLMWSASSTTMTVWRIPNDQYYEVREKVGENNQSLAMILFIRRAVKDRGFII